MKTSKRSTQLLADYDRIVHTVRIPLLERYPAKLVWGALAEARQELTRLLPRIPDLGPGHRWQFNLNICTMELALYRTLQRWGFTLPEVAQFTYDLAEAYLQNGPWLARGVYRWHHLSRFLRSKLRRTAVDWQQQQDPQDWWDGHASGLGVDTSECAVGKFFRAQRAEELVPYLCALDYALSKRLGLGFIRTRTLAEGTPCCDCRWKGGAETIGWPLAGQNRPAPQKIGGIW